MSGHFPKYSKFKYHLRGRIELTVSPNDSDRDIFLQ